MRSTNTPSAVTPSRRSIPAALLALLVVATATPARAQVQDQAGFFSGDAVNRATQTLDRIKREYGKDFRVETYPGVPSNQQGEFQRLGKEQFYEQWAEARGKALGLDGLIVLITREPPRIQIQVGRATRTAAFTQSNRQELFDTLSGRFKAKQYDDGLMDAADYVYRQMGQNLRAAQGSAGRSGAAAGSGSSAGTGSGATYPPAPGGGSAGGNAGSNRTSSPPPGAGRPGVACGGGMGSMLCMIIAIVGAVILIRRMFAGRSAGYGGGGYGQQTPPNAPYGGPGYGGGYGGGGGGGGFGRGVLGGILGGVLGGWAQDKMSGRSHHDAGSSGMGGMGGGGGLPPTDPSTFDSGATGGDFGGGGGGDFGGGGGGGGGDSGSSGGDF